MKTIYTIIDVETTGPTNRITEISIFKYQDGEIIDEFTSLVNPECEIPFNITVLTGIDYAMVADAPIFEEIAQDVLRITEGTIFVAHSVNFDYNVIRNEFKKIDIDFRRAKLCTVRLSRKLIPGYRSYSLGKICNDLDIKIEGRHRARGDAHATVKLFAILQSQGNWDEVKTSFLKKTSKEATLPPHLPSEVFNAIPHAAGIYFFKDKKGKIIYVGKAKDLKKRVLGHFYNKTKKELDLCRETRDISFELSGTELIALLMEDAAIKHHFPRYNKAAKRTIKGFALMSYLDQKGVIHLGINNMKLVSNALQTFYSAKAARQSLEELCEEYDLCPKYCHLQEGVDSCSHYYLTCKGVCRSEEEIESYNERAQLAIQSLSDENINIVIKQKGRSDHEEAFILVKEGKYLGYGFVDKSITIVDSFQLEDHLTLQKDNANVRGILRSYIQKEQLLIG